MFIASPADLADTQDCDHLVSLLLDRHGGVAFLVNNAGRSIRRAIESSYPGEFEDQGITFTSNMPLCTR